VGSEVCAACQADGASSCRQIQELRTYIISESIFSLV
jgi:hypothetical protein